MWTNIRELNFIYSFNVLSNTKKAPKPLHLKISEREDCKKYIKKDQYQ